MFLIMSPSLRKIYTIIIIIIIKMTLKNQNDDKKSLSITQNVISMDSAPCDEESVLASQSVMFIHWRTMSGFLKWRDVTADGKPIRRATIERTFEILVN